MKTAIHRFAQLSLLCMLLFSAKRVQAQTDTITVTVHGHKMVFYCTGTGPLVIMEAGHGASHRSWRAVDTKLSAIARVITYDRPGYAGADTCSSARDAITVAKELKEALEKANLQPPYILAGWSLGGSFARVFAGLYPQSVSGLVLVDPAPEASYARFEKEHPELMKEDSIYIHQIMQSTDRPGEKAELISFNESMKQAEASDHMHNTKTILLIAAGGENRKQDNPLNRIWVEELVKWAKKRPNLQYKIIENSGHHIARDQPQEVIAAISQLVIQQKIK